MRPDCCRSAGLAPDSVCSLFERGSIPGAVPGRIPDEYSANQPIYLEGPISLDEFLARDKEPGNDLDMNPQRAGQNSLLWPVISRFSFVAALSAAIISTFSICLQAQARDEKISGNLKIAARNDCASTSSGRIISFVCGRPNTLQLLAPIDLPEAKPVRFLPQGASPIAEMKYMPAAPAMKATKTPTDTGAKTKTEASAGDRIYRRLLKLSLADPAVYEAEGSSLITYFSILTGGQDKQRVQQLEKILEKNLNEK
ncbi:MAG: hypothetical protein K2Y39_15890 [Candidatus Obscuribacterales bacterium]|nr:hypothetical protein [Candidatus Obscuribacterales bacterium]